MRRAELQELTASEPLSLSEEVEMQRAWACDAEKRTFLLVDPRALRARLRARLHALGATALLRDLPDVDGDAGQQQQAHQQQAHQQQGQSEGLKKPGAGEQQRERAEEAAEKETERELRTLFLRVAEPLHGEVFAAQRYEFPESWIVPDFPVPSSAPAPVPAPVPAAAPVCTAALDAAAPSSWPALPAPLLLFARTDPTSGASPLSRLADAPHLRSATLLALEALALSDAPSPGPPPAPALVGDVNIFFHPYLPREERDEARARAKAARTEQDAGDEAEEEEEDEEDPLEQREIGEVEVMVAETGARRRGLARSAVTAMLRVARHAAGTRRFVAKVIDSNGASALLPPPVPASALLLFLSRLRPRRIASASRASSSLTSLSFSTLPAAEPSLCLFGRRLGFIEAARVECFNEVHFRLELPAAP